MYEWFIQVLQVFHIHPRFPKVKQLSLPPGVSYNSGTQYFVKSEHLEMFRLFFGAFETTKLVDDKFGDYTTL